MNTLRVLWRSTVGKKAVMALTGVVLFVWLLLHVGGNLLVFAGPHVVDGYGAALHARPWLLWPMRIGLLLAAGLHIAAAVPLARRARQARQRSGAAHELAAAEVRDGLAETTLELITLDLPLHFLHARLESDGRSRHAPGQAGEQAEQEGRGSAQGRLRREKRLSQPISAAPEQT